MAYHGVLTKAAFEEAVRPEHVRVSQILQLAIMMGPLLFAFVVVVMALQGYGVQRAGGDTGYLWLLTIIHLAYTVGAFLAGHLLSQRFFSPERRPGDMSHDDAPALALKCIGLYRTATIIRLALMESAAFFGLVICLLAVHNGVLPADTTYWINLASTVFLVLYCIMTLPTKERLADWFEKHVPS